MSTPFKSGPADRAAAIVDLITSDAITKALDDEHVELQAGLAALYDAIAAGADTERLAHILDDIESFCLAHFASEEQFFHDRECPKFEAHETAHRQLIHRLDTVRNSISTGQFTASDASGLMDAFRRHIAAFDKPAHVRSLWAHVEAGDETSQQIQELCSLDRLGKMTW